MSSELTRWGCTLEELTNHTDEWDCWIAINGKVYDVTKWKTKHPGGSDVIWELRGKDASKAFNNVGHSQTAMNILAEYYIGDIIKQGQTDTDAGVDSRGFEKRATTANGVNNSLHSKQAYSYDLLVPLLFVLAVLYYLFL